MVSFHPTTGGVIASAREAGLGAESGRELDFAHTHREGRPLGGMADAADLKSAARKSVRVQSPEGPLRDFAVLFSGRSKGALQPDFLVVGTTGP